jgi:hypothetical protein
MLPKNPWLLLGLLGILIPIIIHLLNRRSNRVIEWGAMDFLFQSLAIRNRRIQLEEALLMAARCLLVGLLALALVRPFVQPGSSVPWLLVIPMLLLGIVGLGVATTLQNEKKWRAIVALVAIVLLAGGAALIKLEHHLNLSRFGAAGAQQDIALVIDGSTSMTMEIDGISNFERAIEEAKTLVKSAPRGHAFSLIIGGPTPAAKFLAPTSNRADLLLALDEATPLDGPMAAYHSLTLASLGLAQGNHDGKQIIILTDAQNVGWENGETARWSFLQEAFKNLPSEPRVTLRQLPLPDQVRNLAISDIGWSREIVGIDRPVDIRVEIENTGHEAVTPEAVHLEIDGETYDDRSLGQIAPGAKETVLFTHRFSNPGGHAFSATLEANDEIPQDDRRDAAINVADVLRVLIVDGRSAPRFFDRAASFTALALAPASSTARTAGVDSTDSGETIIEDPVRFLVEPRVLPVAEILNAGQFNQLDAVILADVPRLPEAVADRLLTFVKNGGGLLVAPGQRAHTEFYNAWRDSDGQALLPAQLGKNFVVAPLDDPPSPSVATFGHPGLRKIADPKQSDFASVQVSGYWPLEVPASQATDSAIGARLSNGEPFLVSRRYGNGQVILLDTSLDTTTGNLPTRQSFLPFIHELVYQLANPSAYDLNLDAGWDVALHLSGNSGAGSGQGLRGLYFKNHKDQKPAHTRTDAGLDARWGTSSPAPGMPADNFRVEWFGSLRVPATAVYRFDASFDDQLEIWIDGRALFSGDTRRPKSIKLEEGRRYSFRAQFHEQGGEAYAQLYWETKEMPRQIVPAAAFHAAPADVGKASEGLEDSDILEVTGPDESPRSAELVASGAGTVARIRGDIVSGAYQLQIPKQRRAEFNRFLTDGADSIPFTVKRDPAESRLTALEESDFAFLDKFITIGRPESLEDLIALLSGNDFGRELWKYLALGAFAFLLLEIALSRWIARERRTGETIDVDFESNDAPSSAFKEQLAKFSSKELGAKS